MVVAEVGLVVAETGSCADAARGGLPKPTDDSLTGFLQASPDRSKMGWCARRGAWLRSRGGRGGGLVVGRGHGGFTEIHG